MAAQNLARAVYTPAELGHAGGADQNGVNQAILIVVTPLPFDLKLRVLSNRLLMTRSRDDRPMAGSGQTG